ncbi:MAG: ATP-binding protein [Candidatus Dormibacteraeota bacterium]|uniref:ATP-binding protein n=1 Tax=Candidatus Amunia macphersoniae TaxID=3127014 RepID=A0A934NFJ2_9BACT|nr:ATP-binding protein [Candidatus Dormibacteraeota bacterium]
MSTDISAAPFRLDVRVARSPLTALRFGVDGRSTDIDDVIKRLELAHGEASARREDVRTRLLPYQASRRAMLERLGRGSGKELRTRLDEDLELGTELAGLEERVACLRERIDSLRDQRSTMRDISVALAKIDSLHTASIDGAGAAQNQAVRQLYHLIERDHQTAAQRILEGPMQLLAGAAMQTELVGRVARQNPKEAADGAAKCRQAADAALRELNRVVFGIHPDDLRQLGLVPMVRRLLSDVTRVDHQVLVLGRARRLRHRVEVAVFRIVQEAVTNSVAHGSAQNIEVVLLFQPQRVALVVRDDGEGFDVAATEARLGRSTGLGLITMRQRAEIENGHLEIRSVVGEGTEVRASFSSPG